MISQINDFVSRFCAKISLDESMIVGKQNRHFFLNQNLRRIINKDFYYAGLYLGKTKNERFFPSFNLLRLISQKNANKIIVDKKSEWLFICGRDVFRKGIVKVTGSRRKGDYTLILNRHGECLGFGRILHDLDEKKDEVAVKNILDIGDFLRREPR